MKKYMGIDPGSHVTGWGLIVWDGIRSHPIRFLEAGIISHRSGMSLAHRLATIYNITRKVIEQHQPSACAVEDCFVRHPKSALILGQARGAAMAAVACAGVPVYEYTATAAKLCVAGHGRSGKDAVAHWLRLTVEGIPDKMAEDASDAVAQAVCCAMRMVDDGR